MKQLLLGSGLGHYALSVRDKTDLVMAALGKREAVGTLSNDQLATYLVTRICRTGGVFVDVGAHIGSITAEVRRHCPSARIYAIEAIPEKAEHIGRLFPGVEVRNYAVGDCDGEVAFYVNTRRSGYSSLVKPTDSGGVREINVQLRKLDDLIPHQEIDVIKIDVEGAELSVLQGGTGIVGGSRPLIMFESAPGENSLKEGLWKYFHNHDYSIFVPNRLAHDGPQLGLESFLEGHFYPRRTTNYFAVPVERRLEIRDRARALLNIAC